MNTDGTLASPLMVEPPTAGKVQPIPLPPPAVAPVASHPISAPLPVVPTPWRTWAQQARFVYIPRLVFTLGLISAIYLWFKHIH